MTPQVESERHGTSDSPAPQREGGWFDVESGEVEKESFSPSSARLTILPPEAVLSMRIDTSVKMTVDDHGSVGLET